MSKFAVIITFSLVSTSAIALQTTVSATGKVVNIYNPGGFAPSSVKVGETVVATLGYGDVASTNSTPSDPARVSYSFSRGGSPFQISIGNLVWRVSAGTSEVVLENDQPVRNRDVYYVRSFDLYGAAATFPGSIDASYLFLGLIDWTAPYELVSSLNLPRSDSDINLSAINSIHQGGINSYGSAGPTNSWTINYSIDTITISTVPEPSKLVLLFASALFLGAIGKIRGRVNLV